MYSRRSWSSRSRWRLGRKRWTPASLSLRGPRRGDRAARRRLFWQRRDNRAARIMNAAHGGQVLTSQAVAELVQGRLPAGLALCDLGPCACGTWRAPNACSSYNMPDCVRHFQRCDPWRLCQQPAAQLTTFIGREREQEQIKAALKKARLLTLTGIGGIGKTRLSLQVAADVVNDYADGVWFVELAPITDGDLVPQAVATILGVKEEAGRPLTEALVACARERSCCWCSTTASIWCPRAPSLRGSCSRRVPGLVSSHRAESRSTSPAKVLYGPAASVPSRTEAWPPIRSCGLKLCICSSSARRRCRLRSAQRSGHAGDRRNLPATRRHSARA